MFELDLQPDDQHAAWRVEGILTGGRVYATIHFVEKIVDADARFHQCPPRAVKGMCGVEIPDTIARRILVSASIIGLRLQAPVQVYIQSIAAPCVVVVGSDGGGVADATLLWLPGRHHP